MVATYHTVAASSGSTVMDDKLARGTFIPPWPNWRSPCDMRVRDGTEDNSMISLDSMPPGNSAPLCLYCCICLSLSRSLSHSLYPLFSWAFSLSFSLFQSLTPSTYQSVKMQEMKALAHSKIHGSQRGLRLKKEREEMSYDRRSHHSLEWVYFCVAAF